MHVVYSVASPLTHGPAIFDLIITSAPRLPVTALSTRALCFCSVGTPGLTCESINKPLVTRGPYESLMMAKACWIQKRIELDVLKSITTALCIKRALCVPYVRRLPVVFPHTRGPVIYPLSIKH